MPQPKKIVVFGSIVHDLVSYTEEFPRPGESVRGNAFKMNHGGKGANTAVAAARLGGEVEFIGKVGDDIFGESNRRALQEAGVDTTHLETSKTGQTATATLIVNAHGENCIVVTLGANLEIDDDTAEKHEEALKNAAIVSIQGEVTQRGNKRIFELAKDHGVKTFFNPAPGDPNLDRSILPLTDIVCTNENEAEFLTGIKQNSMDDARRAAAQMLTMGPEHAIITLGPRGCILASKGGEIEHIPSKKVKAVDTTGAGDCFCGSFIYFLINTDCSIRDAVEKAANIASLSVQRKGTQDSYWTREEIEVEHPEFLE
ncbi:unnamed protein product [Cylicocyclus nassatus]|uniref:Ribokinase n=1 Tax=Cylicocyclus nassatus TaxID=53992 RepID=A0AA36HCW3_CYLNA|nr:unnamed protein product [Cylicocyclus nassatus]